MCPGLEDFRPLPTLKGPPLRENISGFHVQGETATRIRIMALIIRGVQRLHPYALGGPEDSWNLLTLPKVCFISDMRPAAGTYILKQLPSHRLTYQAITWISIRAALTFCTS